MCDGAPGRTRTCDSRIRNPVLYPPELRGHKCCAIVGGGWKIVAMSYTNGCLFASNFHFLTHTAECQPGYFIHCCREATQMGVPPGNSSRGTAGLVPRHTSMVRRRGRHPRTPGFRLVEPTAWREGRPLIADWRLRIADLSLQKTSKRKQTAGSEFHSCFTQITSLHQTSFNLRSKI